MTTSRAVRRGSSSGLDAFATSILDRVVQPVCVADHAGLIRFANPSAVAALGYADVAELLGKPSHPTIHYKRPDGSVFPVEECPILRPRVTGETTHNSEDWLVRQDGSMFPVEYWSAPIDAPGGRGAVVAFTDTSERRRSERALRERDAILSALGQPVWVVTHEGVISHVNQAAVQALGFGDASELIGQNGHWLVHYKRPDGSRFPIEDCPLTRCRETGDRLYLDEDWWVRKDGSMIPVSGTAAPIETSEGYGTAVAFTDMTARLAAEQAAQTKLAASRARMVTAFDAARQRVTRDLHDGAQQRFVSSMINLQLAQQKWTSAPEHSRKLLDRALRDAKSGIDELREIAAGIHPAILTQRGLAAALDSLAARLPIPVELDVVAVRLPQPIESSVYFFCSEALTNVVKHAQAKSVWVQITLQDDRCTVEVRDDGIGGAEPRPEASGLTGLRDRIGALSGLMEVSSPVAAGTTLRAWVPLSPKPAWTEYEFDA